MPDYLRLVENIAPENLVNLLSPGLSVMGECCSKSLGVPIIKIKAEEVDGQIVVAGVDKKIVLFDTGWRDRSRDDVMSVAANIMTAAACEVYGITEAVLREKNFTDDAIDDGPTWLVAAKSLSN